MAGIGRSAFYRLKTLATQGCLRTNSTTLVRPCSSSSKIQKSKPINLTDPTKDPEYKSHVERFADISDPDENYYWHGYNPYDREDDTFWHHHTMFVAISLCFVGGAVIIAYIPDHKLQNWRQREAYIQLARREAQGLPLIDPNLVPPEKMLNFLPSDAELGDTDIIV